MDMFACICIYTYIYTHTYTYTHTQIYFKESGLVSLKFVRQASRLETQAGADATVLRQNFLFSGKPEFLLVRSFN